MITAQLPDLARWRATNDMPRFGTLPEQSRWVTSGTLLTAAPDDFSLPQATRFHVAASRLLDQHPALLVADLSTVRFLAVSGVRALLEAHAEAQNREIRLALLAPSPQAAHALQVTGVNGDFDIYARISDAIDTADPSEGKPIPESATTTGLSGQLDQQDLSDW